ncbi:hypothetical protein FKW77_005121 [Venturia effusa]|uniref:Glucose-methanol-choline oxidoreductase N-terminal domain-containing protein n=1 Tax=Venturia effusa TaxID=50376 RepID=A0A517LFF4_9PEZI|nr:hypothetical protein FKW77_005121 [Venturia effusa]
MPHAEEARTKFDFIVVGGGPAGCVVASKLARSPKAPHVLLLEAGGSSMDGNAFFLADRYNNFMTFPDYNWGYKSAPQKHLNGRQIDYSRGRGLGGSSRINFACYTIGPKHDYDHWADLVGDDFFNWENSRRRFNTIESYQLDIDSKYKKYADPSQAEHGKSGPLSVSFPKLWERGLSETIDAFKENGNPINTDINSGDPIGFGICPSTSSKGLRMTSATAFLKNPPDNLTIITESPTTKILMDNDLVTGVIAGGKEYFASKEVIICAGALDTPKILKLSGIGPKAELGKHNIECTHDVPGVGENLQDHWYIPLTVQLKPGGDDRPSVLNDPEVLQAAKTQFLKDGTGPISVLFNAINMGWWRPSAELQQTEEFKSLSEDVKKHIRYPTIPTFEVTSHTPTFTPLADPAQSYLTFLVLGMTPQSCGTVTLASSDPKEAPICDPNLFSSAFDRKNLLEATRIAWSVMSSPSLAKDTVSTLSAPKSMSDEDIMQHARETAGTTWHMSCTAKMGKPEDEMAVVDTHFRVKGLVGLRVADMSVTPFVPNCHTMAVAYQIGEMAYERLAAEYGLNICD